MRSSLGYGIAALIAINVAVADPRIEQDVRNARDRRDAELRTRVALAKVVDVNFVDTSLGDAMSQLAKEHDLQIEIDTEDLRDLGIRPEDTFTCVLTRVPLHDVLRIILQRKVLDLDYEFDGNLIRITTFQPHHLKRHTRVYDVTGLVSKRPNGVVARNKCELTMVYQTINPGPACFSILDTGHGEKETSVAGDNVVGVDNVEVVESSSTETAGDKGNPRFIATRHTDHYDFDSLVDTICTVVTPYDWTTPENINEAVARPLVVGERCLLIVEHTRRGHAELAAFLSQIDDVLSDGRQAD